MRSLVKIHVSPSLLSPSLDGGAVIKSISLEGEGKGEGASPYL
jgi:hypothetical protein